MVDSTWGEVIPGSVMFSLAVKQRETRTKLQKWCVNNRKLWGVNWRLVTNSLSRASKEISSLHQGRIFVDQLYNWEEKCRLGLDY